MKTRFPSRRHGVDRLTGPAYAGDVRLKDAALEEGDVIIEITPRHVFSWGLD
jgi:hypothetical protein